MFYLVVIFLLIFQGTLENLIGIGFLDEIILITLFLICLKKILLDRKEIKLYRLEKWIFLCFFCYFIIGVISDITFNIQNDHLFSLTSGFLSIKFILLYYMSRICIPELKIKRKNLRKIYYFLKAILFGYAFVGGLNIIFNFLSYVDIRYGIKSVPLGFSHVAELDFFAFSIFTLMLFFNSIYKFEKVYSLNFIPLLIITLVSGRTKALAFFMLLLALYFMLNVTGKIKIKYFLYISPIIIWIGYDRIIKNLFSSKEARGVLLRTSIEIAKDFFPLGSGFGTFATYFSTTRYSPLYYYYGINNVWGISPEKTDFAMDAHWAAITAESGFIGLIFYLIAILLLFILLFKFKVEPKVKLAMTSLLLYCIIASTADSIFTSYRGGAVFIIITFFINNVKNHTNKLKDEKG